MQKLMEQHGTQTSLRALRFLAIRLNSRQETKPLIPVLKQSIKDLASKNDIHETLQEERMAATAEIQYSDSVIDKMISDLSRKALIETNNDRKSPFYRRLFPITPSEATKTTGGADQIKFVDVVLEQLSSLKEYKVFTEEAKALSSAQKDLKIALEQRTGLYQKEAQAQIEWSIALDDARRTYNRTYFQLQLMLDNESLIESFFRRLRNARTTKSTPSEDPNHS